VSAIEGMVISIHGASAKVPYLAASKARSIVSIWSPRRMRP